MDFYRELAPYYNIIFPSNPQRLEFVSSRFSKGNTLLDLGCGTGILAHQLAESGFLITGIDLEEKMIIEALKNASLTGVETFVTGNLLEMDRYFQESSFDGILCLGNTLPHLANQEEVNSLFNKTNSLVKSGGKAIFQTVNFDQFSCLQNYNFPDIENNDLIFKRSYENITSSSLDFESILYLKKNHKKLALRQRLIFISHKALDDFAKSNGFINIEFYGNFLGDDWNSNSPATIMTVNLP
jgi:2-polyprenyl-3-methyl-5-hydroxy-6-metoxy-1,4-benzoquinol methylase